MYQDFILLYLITDVASWSILIPFLVGISFLRTYGKDQRLLFWYILGAAFTEVLSSYLSLNSVNNLPLLHAFTVFEFSVLCLYMQLILKDAGIRLQAHFLIFGFLLVSIINVIYFESLHTYNTNGRTLEGTIFILLSGYYLYKLATNSSVLYLTEFSGFWGGVAILFYFAGTIFIFAYSRLYLENWEQYFPAVYSIHSVFNIGFNLLLTKALWKPQTM